MFGKKIPEVLIVGAGPVGLFAALVLARRGIRVQIVDKEWRTGAHSYAMALHPQSLALFKEAGLYDRVVELAYPVTTIGLYDSVARRGEIRLESSTIGSPFVAVLRQDVLEQLLEEALAQMKVPVYWNHDVSRLVAGCDSVTATIDKLEKDSIGYGVAHTEWIVAKSADLAVPFVLGADGHRSRVRRALGIEFPEVAQPQYFAVFEFQTNADLHQEMRLVLAEQTTSVLWPLPGGRCRWSFELTDFTVPDATRLKDRIRLYLGGEQFPVLSKESLENFITQRAPWFTGSIDEVNWQIVVRFERRLAGSFGRGRMCLLGDAAHMTGPVGMQSMNLGLFEARDLAEILARVLREGGRLDELDGCHQRWESVWRHLLGVDGGLHPQPLVDPWIGRHAARLMFCLPAHGAELTALANQLGLQG
jgi:NADPH-dependent dioxygenase